MGLMFLFALRPATAQSQDTERDGWNTDTALELIRRARDVRQGLASDPGLRTYRSNATGRIFFLIDRPDTDRRTLVKADQIALEVYWRAPRGTRQRIVGLRDEKLLPTNIRYHLDHLTVVQDDFADRIRLGDGDEVEAVLHPAAPGAETVYDYRLGDSLAIASPGTEFMVRVNEVQVRPKRLAEPGFVGSVFLDRATAAIVRMTFTFTPASYVDRYLDYIRISLDNSLWRRRWWLPYRQEVEIRREMPLFDFLAGSVIRGRFEISDYEFNVELPDHLFLGSTVTAAPQAERERYPFGESLIPEAEASELAQTPSLREIRARALELTAGRYLSGLAPLRLYVPSVSHVFRWNRGEQAFVGLGLAWRPSGDRVVKAHGGWGFGASRPSATVAIENASGRTGIRAFWRELRDLGPLASLSHGLNTFLALTGEGDWIDPWVSSGFSIFLGSAPSDAPTRVSLTWERHDPSRTVLDPHDARRYRPLPGVAKGWLGTIELSHSKALTDALALDVVGQLGWFDPDGYEDVNAVGQTHGVLQWERVGLGTDVDLRASVHAGFAFGDVPPQQLYYLGGRGTLPGHPFRAQSGNGFWLASAEATFALFDPWVALRMFAAAGAVRDGSVLASAGPGLGLGWNVVHLDLGRGLNDGHWEWVVSVDRRFRRWL